MSKVITLSGLGDFNGAPASARIVIVFFWAPWSGPSRLAAPEFDKLPNDFPRSKFYKVDMDEEGEIITAANIRVTPSYLIYKDGEKVDEVHGYAPQKLIDLCTQLEA